MNVFIYLLSILSEEGGCHKGGDGLFRDVYGAGGRVRKPSARESAWIFFMG